MFEMPQWLTFKGYRASFGGQELGIAPIHVHGDDGVSIILATPGGRSVCDRPYYYFMFVYVCLYFEWDCICVVCVLTYPKINFIST